MKHEGTIIMLVSRTPPCGWHIAVETSNLTYNPLPGNQPYRHLFQFNNP